jgi:arylsulfatase A-like enzyme
MSNKASKTRAARRLFLRFGVIAVLFVLFVVFVVEIRFGDPRSLGSADDIEGLAQRDDLNVLFILVDTLRAHRLGSYGYERDTSPTIDALAADGVRFARHLAQSSWTKCSMASLWTALYPARSRITRFEDVIPETATLPAEILREAGFRTSGLYRNGWVAPNFGFAQGFEIYERPAGRPSPAGVRRENPTVRHVGLDDDLLPATIEFLRIHGRERWFLYLHLMDVHEYLYDEQSALFGTAFSDVYDNAIRRTNTVLAHLLNYLVYEGFRENTLIVFSSDHGEAFQERGLEGHARYVYPETTEVPFVLSFPFRLEPGIVIPTRSQNIDVWPTVLDLLGLPPMEGVDGRSRRPEILAAARGEPVPPATRPAIAHIDRTWGQRGRAPAPTVAVSEDDFRFVRVPGPDGDLEELFDSSRNPAELTNVLQEHPETAERLRSLARAYLEESPPPPWGDEAPALEMDEVQLNQLRALGYSIP